MTLKLELAALASVVTLCGAFGNIDLKVDFAQATGPIKPVHATGQGPLQGWCDFSMFKYLKEAGIPYARLHDTAGPFGKNLYVDIPNIFRNFDADENDPKSYDFLYTDLYLKALVENGVEPYFRLGVTIENSVRQTKKAYRLYPPKDFAKWARICEHIVRHYTEGWADGFKYKITYWEVWNEPDDFPDYHNAMWWGTWRQYCELYEATAKHLKACFPHIKIGAYGRCTAHSVTSKAHGKPIHKDEVYRDKCFSEFCAFIKERNCPLDFFSYHGYINPEDVAIHADYHRKALDAIGYTKTELHLNEWLCSNGEHQGLYWQNARCSARFAAFLVALQNSKTDVACVYDGRCQLSAYSPLFDPVTCTPGKTFWAFKDFNVLYRLGTAVNVTWRSAREEGLWATAAKGAAGGAVLLVNQGAKPQKLTLDLGGRTVTSCRITDAARNDAPCALPVEMPATSYLLVQVQ